MFGALTQENKSGAGGFVDTPHCVFVCGLYPP